jgi:transcriptional regulator GlxA family with amidase domain
LEERIVDALNTEERIQIVEGFLIHQLSKQATIDNVVRSTVQSLINSSGNISISNILKNDESKRRQLERKFSKQIGMSPKQLGKVIRLQTALKTMLTKKSQKLTNIAYENDYYDQAHFIRDFKEFTGVVPSEFMNEETLALSSLFYQKK